MQKQVLVQYKIIILVHVNKLLKKNQTKEKLSNLYVSKNGPVRAITDQFDCSEVGFGDASLFRFIDFAF